MLKFGIVGIGQAGGNIAEYAMTKGFKSIAINTAKIDLNLLKYIPDDSKIYLQGYNGAGRNRDIGKEAFVENVNMIFDICKNKLSDCDVLFIAGSGGGGTGSGALPIAIDVLLEMFEILNIIYILPDENESPSAKMNAYDCFAELSNNQQLGSIFILDNQRGKELIANTPKFKVQQMINKQLIDYLCEINQLTDKVSYTNNFDNKDLFDILSIRGCTLVSRCNFNIKQTNINDITLNIQKSWKETFSSDFDISNVIKSAMIGKVKKQYSNKINIQDIFNGNIPYDIKDSYFNVKDDMCSFYTILSGLQFPQQRLNTMKSDIEKVQENLMKRLEISQNQKLQNIDWKLNVPKINNLKNNTPLSERLQKYK